MIQWGLTLTSDPIKGLVLSSLMWLRIHQHCDLYFTHRRTLLVWHSYRTRKVLCVSSHLGLHMFHCSKLFIAYRRTLLFYIKRDNLSKDLPQTRYCKLSHMWKELILCFRTQFRSENGLTLSPPLRVSIRHHCDLHFTYRRTLLVRHSYPTKKLLCVTSHLRLLMFWWSGLSIAYRRTLLLPQFLRIGCIVF
jgi:hypothetical protein